MTGGSPQTDPRDDAGFRPWDAALPSDAAVVAAVKALLHGPGEWIGDGLQIAQLGQQIVRAVHAADEASGVRRVTAQELAAQLELARGEERQRIAEGLQMTRSLGDRPALLQHVDRIIESAADSPVGGVS